HLVGGVPRAEIEAKKELLDAYGVALTDLFAEREPADVAYVDFLPEEQRPDAARLGELARPREDALRAAFGEWWKAEARHLESVAATKERLADLTSSERKAALMTVRGSLMGSFVERLSGVGLLDRYALAGAVAGWWYEAKYDLLALSENGFKGVVDGWVENVDALLAPEQDPKTRKLRKRTTAERRQAYDHKIVAAIAPDFLAELADADARKAELDARWKELNAEPEPSEDGEGGGDEDAVTREAVSLSVEQLAELAQVKKDRAKVGAEIKRREADFWFEWTPGAQLKLGEEKPRLFRAREALTGEDEQRVVLDLLRADLAGKLDGHVVRRRRELVDAYGLWADKYAVSLKEIQAGREKATATLDGFLEELGYVA
ncbi:MAG: type I restriction-modification system subunit M, partial [Gaiellales bacterium]